MNELFHDSPDPALADIDAVIKLQQPEIPADFDMGGELPSGGMVFKRTYREGIPTPFYEMLLYSELANTPAGIDFKEKFQTALFKERADMIQLAIELGELYQTEITPFGVSMQCDDDNGVEHDVLRIDGEQDFIDPPSTMAFKTVLEEDGSYTYELLHPQAVTIGDTTYRVGFGIHLATLDFNTLVSPIDELTRCKKPELAIRRYVNPYAALYYEDDRELGDFVVPFEISD